MDETITVQVYTCLRCGYRWVPKFIFDHWKKLPGEGRTEKPVACAHCHSPYYDKPRKE